MLVSVVSGVVVVVVAVVVVVSRHYKPFSLCFLLLHSLCAHYSIVCI